MTVAINLDRYSLENLEGFLAVAEDNGWSGNPYVTLELGRVDDRFFEGCADGIMDESELLRFLLDYRKDHGLPSNVRFAFMRAIAPLAHMLGVTDDMEFGRTRLNYCWASSPVNRVYYVDRNLDVFRCTYCVGRPSEAIGNLSKGFIDCLPQTYVFRDEECWNCPIGGFCAGGCSNSRKVSKERSCLEEKENFDRFTEIILIPVIAEKLNLDCKS